MKKAKEKLTNKEMTGVMTQLAMRLEQVTQMVINVDRLLNEYMDYMENKEEFAAYLKEKLELDDRDTEKTEDK
jgi:hypothetical protein